jgi:hypothetical protein
VGVAVLNSPQDCSRSKLRFDATMNFNFCFGVGHAIFSACATWFHADAGWEWMWRYVSIDIFSTPFCKENPSMATIKNPAHAIHFLLVFFLGNRLFLGES